MKRRMRSLKEMAAAAENTVAKRLIEKERRDDYTKKILSRVLTELEEDIAKGIEIILRKKMG